MTAVIKIQQLDILAMATNEGGNENTGIGFWSMRDNTEGFWNTSVGAYSMVANTTGNSNTAVGAHLHYARNTTGVWNTALGFNTLFKNTTAYGNTAVGTSALKENLTGTREYGNGAKRYCFQIPVDNTMFL
jgi:hypothetical protein